MLYCEKIANRINSRYLNVKNTRMLFLSKYLMSQLFLLRFHLMVHSDLLEIRRLGERHIYEHLKEKRNRTTKQKLERKTCIHYEFIPFPSTEFIDLERIFRNRICGIRDTYTTYRMK